MPKTFQCLYLAPKCTTWASFILSKPLSTLTPYFASIPAHNSNANHNLVHVEVILCSSEHITAIQPLQQRRHAKVLLQAEKYKYLPDHPMKEKVQGRTKNRIKRSSFTHEVKKLQKDYPAVLTISTLPLSKQDFNNPLWKHYFWSPDQKHHPSTRPGKRTGCLYQT